MQFQICDYIFAGTIFCMVQYFAYLNRVLDSFHSFILKEQSTDKFSLDFFWNFQVEKQYCLFEMGFRYYLVFRDRQETIAHYIWKDRRVFTQGFSPAVEGYYVDWFFRVMSRGVDHLDLNKILTGDVYINELNSTVIDYINQ